ncbi:hypothetical protein M2118_000581 [Aurantimicrobium minutum]|jgi:hypothetical protein|nr:hypothetical protein [Aurantimicrobium minutum]MDH6277618.1 hypothetical protein [Aurantimicrobium minutum]
MAGALPEIDLKRLSEPIGNVETSPIILNSSHGIRVISGAQNKGTLR